MVMTPTRASHAQTGTSMSTNRLDPVAAVMAAVTGRPGDSGAVGASNLRCDLVGPTEGLSRPIRGHGHRVEHRDDDDRARDTPLRRGQATALPTVPVGKFAPFPCRIGDR